MPDNVKTNFDIFPAQTSHWHAVDGSFYVLDPHEPFGIPEIREVLKLLNLTVTGSFFNGPDFPEILKPHFFKKVP